MHKIMLVDDHPLTRRGLRLILEEEPDLAVTSEAVCAEEAIEVLRTETPDLILVDLSLPGMSGLAFIAYVHTWKPDVSMIVLTRHDTSICAHLALKAGARGYVTKMQAADTLARAIRHVLDSGYYVSEEVADLLLRNLASEAAVTSTSPLGVLSARELEVFEMIGRGLGTQEIADTLGLSVKTVASYLRYYSP